MLLQRSETDNGNLMEYKKYLHVILLHTIELRKFIIDLPVFNIC